MGINYIHGVENSVFFKMSHPKLQYSFTEISRKSLKGLYSKLSYSCKIICRQFLKFILKCEEPRVAKAVLRKRKIQRTELIDIKIYF